MISDPGCNRKECSQSTFIFLTHGHVDHSLLAGIFENAKFVTFESLRYNKDLQFEFKDDVLEPDIYEENNMHFWR